MSNSGKEFLIAHNINIPDNIEELINSTSLTREQNAQFNMFISAFLSISSPEQIVTNYIKESPKSSRATDETEPVTQQTQALMTQPLTTSAEETLTRASHSRLPKWLAEMETDLKYNQPTSGDPQWFSEMSSAETLSKEQSAEKYETIPTPEEANFILVSMGNIGRIEAFLRDFPKSNGKEGHVGSIACSSTLIWSGTEGNNVPTELYRKLPFGFTLDPLKIVVPYAECLASGTSSIVPSEYPKFDSKYKEGKMGRIITTGGQPIVNHARWQNISKKKWPRTRYMA